MKTLAMNCIVCPLGCLGQVIVEAETVTETSGFSCKRGLKYAQAEITCPKRVLTTTVRVQNGALPLLPVVSSEPIEKRLILPAVNFLKKMVVTVPVQAGDVICGNILGTGADIVASRDLGCKK
ncbi:MAG: DUF1667 domain-containing protein [Sporomusaceae bacterium]|jgi:CxxC motif-containing protein|nr:DUF1667 domain-containing protein [Sporomusaceae bacterium]